MKLTEQRSLNLKTKGLFMKKIVLYIVALIQLMNLSHLYAMHGLTAKEIEKLPEKISVTFADGSSQSLAMKDYLQFTTLTHVAQDAGDSAPVILPPFITNKILWDLLLNNLLHHHNAMNIGCFSPAKLSNLFNAADYLGFNNLLIKKIKQTLCEKLCNATIDPRTMPQSMCMLAPRLQQQLTRRVTNPTAYAWLLSQCPLTPCQAPADTYECLISQCTHTPDGNLIFFTSLGGKYIYAWDVNNNTMHTIPAKFDCLACSCDGSLLAVSNKTFSKPIYLFDTQTMQCVGRFTDHITTDVTDTISQLCFSPDNQLLVVAASGNNEIHVWNIKTGQYQGILKEKNIYSMSALRFSADSKLLAFISHDHTVHIFDIINGHCVHEYTDHSKPVNDICFSPNGQYLASASDDCTIKLWNVVNDQCHATLSGHAGPVKQLAFSSSGKYLASVSCQCAIRIWNTKTGVCLHTLAEHLCQIKNIFFVGDNLLVSASEDATVRMWDIKSGNCIHTITIPPKIEKPQCNSDQIDYNRSWPFSPRLSRDFHAQTPPTLGDFLDEHTDTFTPASSEGKEWPADYRIPNNHPIATILVPRCMRLAIVPEHGTVQLFDLQRLIQLSHELTTMTLAQAFALQQIYIRINNGEQWNPQNNQEQQTLCNFLPPTMQTILHAYRQ